MIKSLVQKLNGRVAGGWFAVGVGGQSLRKPINGQLDKLESTHSFARAVFYGQNGPIPYAGKEEQQCWCRIRLCAGIAST